MQARAGAFGDVAMTVPRTWTERRLQETLRIPFAVPVTAYPSDVLMSGWCAVGVCITMRDRLNGSGFGMASAYGRPTFTASRAKGVSGASRLRVKVAMSSSPCMPMADNGRLSIF